MPRDVKEAYRVFMYVGLRASCIYRTTDKQAPIEEAGLLTMCEQRDQWKEPESLTKLLNQAAQV